MSNDRDFLLSQNQMNLSISGEEGSFSDNNPNPDANLLSQGIFNDSFADDTPENEVGLPKRNEPDNSPVLEPGIILKERFLLEKKLGEGGMGEIWMATDTTGDIKVALKFVPRDLSRFEQEMKRVRDIYKLVRDLSHPNIAPTYYLEKDAQFGYFLVMKWLPGASLDEIFRNTMKKRGKFPTQLIPSILLPIAEALDYAHGEGVVHRDVKPSNIFLNVQKGKIEDVWLIDFGLASEIQQGLDRISSRQCNTSGTRPYMPPEQWRGKKQDSKTDQYSLAVVAYELYAGELPFLGNDITMLRMSIMNDLPERISSVSDSVNNALQKALAKNRDERFDSCTQFVRALVEKATPKKAPVNPQAEQLFLKAEYYATGDNGKITPNAGKAVEYYRQAAELGHPRAMSILGMCYYDGKGVYKDCVEALKWFRAGAKANDCYAFFLFGDYFENNKDSTGNSISKAKNCYKQFLSSAQKPENQDDPTILNALGWCYDKGCGVVEDNAEAIKWYSQAAKLGSACANYNIGVCFRDGDGVPEDKTEAFKWFSKAAELGYALAQLSIGCAYAYAIGTSENKTEAVKWYRKAAEQGLSYAQFYLGYSYDNAFGISENKTEAVKWYRKAAEQGLIEAQFYLGWSYYNGAGVVQDITTAERWVRKAAEQGFPPAQNVLGLCYQNGNGVPVIPVSAVKWYRMAAEQGFAHAQYNLGECYYNGFGVVKDLTEAKQWFIKAAEQGVEEAINALNQYHFNEIVPVNQNNGNKNQYNGNNSSNNTESSAMPVLELLGGCAVTLAIAYMNSRQRQ